MGSYICKCKSGFRKHHSDQCEGILGKHAEVTMMLNTLIALLVLAFHVIAPKGKI